MEDEFQGGREDDHVGKTGLSDDAFLGGKLQILQPEKGYRAGIDAVLLAASIPASEGDTLFEAGIGTGVAAACLATRVPGVNIAGVEIASRYALIAEENFWRNGLHERIRVLKGDTKRLFHALVRNAFIVGVETATHVGEVSILEKNEWGP